MILYLSESVQFLSRVTPKTEPARDRFPGSSCSFCKINNFFSHFILSIYFFYPFSPLF